MTTQKKKKPEVILPEARYDWHHLRLQDYKSESKYNLSMFKISSPLKLCGENITDKDMLEKTNSTFPVNNMLFHQQLSWTWIHKIFWAYFKYCSLMNKTMNPIGSTPFPEVNVVSIHECKKIIRPFDVVMDMPVIVVLGMVEVMITTVSPFLIK